MRRALLLFVSLVVSGSLTPPAAEARPADRRGTAEAPEARQRSAAVTREALEALEAQLDRAVDRVSLPRVAGLLARDAARGYRLPGYGVVFVLTPRVLPGDGRSVLFHLATPRHRAGPRTQRSEAPDDEGRQGIETLERHVIILQNETEQARRAAEQDMERIVHDVRMRLVAPGETLELASASGDAPQAPPPPNTAPASPEASRAESQPVPTEAPLPPPPPWKYWFESGGTRDERTPQAMVADVRQALIEAFESHPARVPGLRPEEYVTIAVDFEAPDPFAAHARPERTLVVRARAADIEARARAAIGPDEFRRRLEVIEY
jgi:hypothetical protein